MYNYARRWEAKSLEAIIEHHVGAETGQNMKGPKHARVTIVGATGYAGRELIAILARHPQARLTGLMSSGRNAAQPVPVESSHPALRGLATVPIDPFSMERLTPGDTDVVFLATPHEVSHDLVPGLLDRGLRVVDLSAAFRLRDREAYRKWYGFEHRAQTALTEAVYGIPELNGPAIRNAQLVANPGCYPTSIILALAPLLRAGMMDVEAGVICDSKSGATGAGRGLRDDLLFSNVNESCRAYGLFNHRHVPEMLQALDLSGDHFLFTPHLLPISRGLLSSIYLRLSRAFEPEELTGTFRRFYAQAPLVRVYTDGRLPEIQAVAHTQYADIGFAVEPGARRCVIISAIDNLGKGAAGQAVQNMNLMLGYAEDQGLR